MDALIEAAIRLAIPLLLAAMGELICERGGIINIGTEGMMRGGDFAGCAVAVDCGSPWLGILGAAAASAAVGALFAYFTVLRRSDQIVVGTAINLLALGSTGLAARALYQGAIPTGPGFGPLSPSLAAIPWVGPLLFGSNPYVPLALLSAGALAFTLSGTRQGLRLVAVGESARAADSQGVPVTATRFVAVLIGSVFAGVAGSALSLSQTNVFTEGMTAGRGFIALTIVIFGRWRPLGVLLAALFFGAASAHQHRLQARGTALPYQLTLMMPYLLTLLVLALFAGKRGGPADLGQPYRREEH